MYEDKGLNGAIKRLSNTRFELLYASYMMVKSESVERLNISSVSTPNFTRHDAKHAENVVNKMDMLIGEDRIVLLSPTNVWLLLMCAYTHDWGMVVSLADFRDHLKSGNLERHVDELREQHKGMYSLAAHDFDLNRIEDQLNKTNDISNELLNTFNTQRSFMLVIQSYFRKLHAGSYGRVQKNKAMVYDAIDKRLHELVDKINLAHVGDWKNLMKLPKQTDGYSIDFANPRYIAVMLRLADLMDIDSGRVNPFLVRLTANPDSSQAHHEKHLAVRQVLTTPEKIGAHFNFDTDEIEKNYESHGKEAVAKIKRLNTMNEASRIQAQAAREAFAWYDMLREEARHFAADWYDIVPDRYMGTAPSTPDDEFSVSFNNKQIHAKDLDLRYVLSYVRAFDIIRGAGLYSDKLTFIRELVQNAMDAQKIQLFLDWEKKNGFQISPITISKFFSNLPYPIENTSVRVKYEVYRDNNNETVELVISDNGIGISHEKLRQLRYVGNIHDTNTNRIKMRMPDWLLPTGSFGIGLQSVFDFLKSTEPEPLECSFILHTLSSQTSKALRITFRASRTEGEIFYEEYTDERKRRNHGTDVIIRLSKQHLDILLAHADLSGVDMFAGKNRNAIIANHIKKYLSDTVSPDIIPLTFDFIDTTDGSPPVTPMVSVKNTIVPNVFKLSKLINFGDNNG
ncbi:MAG: hypothetical protein FWD90_06525 [Defluviitaleaceae bacterium]|nr:hypothetical protein [Defluviitaleaceae bacterium]